MFDQRKATHGPTEGFLGSSVLDNKDALPKVSPDDIGGNAVFVGYNEDSTPLYCKVDGHLLTVGSTRSGKGVGQIVPNILLCKGSLLVVDPKGENAWLTASYRRDKLKNNVYILDPFNEVNQRYGHQAGDLETVSCFNPLASFNPEDPNYADKVRYLAESLILVQGNDPHWDESALELVKGLIAYVAEAEDEEVSLPNVKRILSGHLPEISKVAKASLEFNGEDSFARRKLARYASLDPKKENREESGIISSAVRQLDFLDCSTLNKSLSSSDFSFDDLVSGDDVTSIYLVLPTDKLNTYRRWLRLMISMLLYSISNNKIIPKVPVTFFLDEFGTIGRLSAIAQAVGLMAGQGVRLWLFLQTLTQLQRDYPDEWENFIGNCCAISVLKAMDNTTTEYLSKLIGEATLVEEKGRYYLLPHSGFPTALNENRDKLLQFNSDKKLLSRPLFYPSEINRLPNKNGLLITDGNTNKFIKAKYFEDENFSDKVRKDPTYIVAD